MGIVLILTNKEMRLVIAHGNPLGKQLIHRKS